MALPSESLGHITPTRLFVVTCGHRCVYARWNCSTPKQKWYVYLNGLGSPGFAPRPKYHASHGTTVEMHGTPAASQASETGLTVSGVDVVSMRSTCSPLMRSWATCEERCGSDCPSLSTMVTSYFLPPMVSPPSNAFRARLSTYASGSPKPAAGPVLGLTKPIFKV